MTKEEETKKLISTLTGKLDALTKIVETLKKPKEEKSVPKEDARDKSIKRCVDWFKGYLEKDIPKEKMDTYAINDLLTAADLKFNTKSSIILNPAPPIGKTDAKKDSRPDWLKATVEQ